MDLPDNFYEPITVYVPAPGTGLRVLIDAGSGIVGHDDEFLDRIRIDYEGNRYHAANIKTFADRVLHAHGRHVLYYPTVARRLVDANDVTAVGTYFPRDRQVDAQDLEAIAEWIGVPLNDADELARQLRAS